MKYIKLYLKTLLCRKYLCRIITVKRWVMNHSEGRLLMRVPKKIFLDGYRINVSEIAKSVVKSAEVYVLFYTIICHEQAVR